ncbi:uncharacterized protein BJX67DRAFT_342572 [Aspergillus lucknowensis]|uniref:Uncharacterized protein n=1 Tax=Aspergillus lucknowensis TaxID=176173 RepID=A0ABR4M4M4_9EURO
MSKQPDCPCASCPNAPKLISCCINLILAVTLLTVRLGSRSIFNILHCSLRSLFMASLSKCKRIQVLSYFFKAPRTARLV